MDIKSTLKIHKAERSPSHKASEDQRRNIMCGVIAISDAQKDIAESLRWGLTALNHRGEDSCGIATCQGNRIHKHRNMGLVETVFSMETEGSQRRTERLLKMLRGKRGIGHTRYSTKGKSNIANAQPIIMKFRAKPFAIAHNGQIGNKTSLKELCEKKGFIFKGDSDTEVIGAMVSLSDKWEFEEAIVDVLQNLQGSFSLVMLYQDKIFATRDSFGNRPLSLGKTESGFIVSSENPVFTILGGTFIRDIVPGELLVVSEDGLDSIIWKLNASSKFCIFELIYFTRPDSKFLNGSLYAGEYRKKLGQFLAKKYKAKKADLVIPVMDSGLYASMGFSRESRVELEGAIVRSTYGVKRTFILKDNTTRRLLQRLKHGLIKSVVEDKIVVVIDDSIVRANTMAYIVKELRKARAKEVHVRISCPPIKHPCFYGINMQTPEELIASSLTVEEIRKKIGADSLEYLDYDSMIKATGCPAQNFCTACFDGKYPIPCEQVKGGE